VRAYIPKDSKQYNPEEKYQNIPGEDEGYANYEWDQVYDGGESSQAAYDFCVNLLHNCQLLLFSTW
jgi:hypothetical protein